MHLEQISRRFDFLALEGHVYRLVPSAVPEAIREAESRFGLKLPEQVAGFWEAFNGLEVEDPPFKILSLSEMRYEEGLLIFCLCDRTVRIAFDIRANNEAGQWSIVNADTNYRVTFTMASFWSSHMWSWIVKRQPIWYDVHSLGVWKRNMDREEAAQLIERFLERRSLYPQEWNDFIDVSQEDRVIENYRQQCNELDPLVNCPEAPDPDAVARLKEIIGHLRPDKV